VITMASNRSAFRTLTVGIGGFVLATVIAWAITDAVRSDEAVQPAGPASAVTPAVDAPPLAAEDASDSKANDVESVSLLPSPLTPITNQTSSGTLRSEDATTTALREVPLGSTLQLDIDPTAEAVSADGVVPADTPTSVSTDTPTAVSEPTRPATGETDTTYTTFAGLLRFVDPCSADPTGCAELAGRSAIGGTIVLISDEPDPVEIRNLTINSGTSDGCAGDEVPAGRRAVGVSMNRPADIVVTWSVFGSTVGTPESHSVSEEAAERFADSPRRGYETCLDVAYPTTAGGEGFRLTVTATAEDGTTDSEWTTGYDDDRRRITIAIVDDDELVAFTPRLPETTVGAIALRDDEDQIAGCQRAADRLLAERPAPGTDGTTGWSVPDTLADRFLPSDGDWLATRFGNLREAQRYGVCLYSYGRARGGRQLEATDAVLVQAPDREVYRIRPVRLTGPGSIDGDRVSVEVPDDRGGRSWTITATTADNPIQELLGTEALVIGELPTPEVLVARVRYDGRTSDALLPLPAHCVSETLCDSFTTTHRYDLVIPGRDYRRRVCGTGADACEGGIRSRAEVLGTVLLDVQRIESRRGFDGWTIGESRRFDVEEPEPYWVRVDVARSGLRVAPDGTVTAEVHTDVASSLRVDLVPCGPGDAADPAPIESAGPATDHVVAFPEPLEVGECVYARYTAADPTGNRIEESGELASTRRR